VELRIDRVGVLLDQLRESRDLYFPRFEGMSAAEYLWEPFDGMHSLRRRGAERTPNAFGPGPWVLDFDDGLDPFAPGPVATIAWRVAHVANGIAGRWEWSFGARSTDPNEVVDFSPDPAMALAGLSELVDRWIASCGTLTDAQLDVPGFSAYPYGMDPHIPFIGVLWWTNREFINHMAEVALLRDLYPRMTAMCDRNQEMTEHMKP
jgi:hypothetical protein